MVLEKTKKVVVIEEGSRIRRHVTKDRAKCKERFLSAYFV